MGHLGIEPRTYRLKAEYSTIELVALKIQINYNSCYACFTKLFFLQLKKKESLFLNCKQCNKDNEQVLNFLI